MALLKKINKKLQSNIETGLSTNSNTTGKRIFNKDGAPNMQVRGGNFLSRFNVYHYLLSVSNLKFIFYILIFFTSINLVFTGVYLLLGVDKLSGLIIHNSFEKFYEVFFFSTQTFTTVGYGRVNPVGFTASLISSIEALTGLLSFAVVTGLLYGRFARPKSYIKFSDNLLFVPFKDGVAIMFRIVPFTKNHLMNVHVKVTLAMQLIDESGQPKNEFYQLKLEVDKANTLALNWTLVHVINEDSPFYGLSKEDIINAKAELLVYVEGFDESFSNTVMKRSSYIADEFVFGGKFVSMYAASADNTHTVLDLDKLSEYTEVNIQLPVTA